MCRMGPLPITVRLIARDPRWLPPYLRPFDYAHGEGAQEPHHGVREFPDIEPPSATAANEYRPRSTGDCGSPNACACNDNCSREERMTKLDLTMSRRHLLTRASAA